jgi:hypothetical protein
MKQLKLGQFSLGRLRSYLASERASSDAVQGNSINESAPTWRSAELCVPPRLPGPPRRLARLPSGAGRHAIIELSE